LRHIASSSWDSGRANVHACGGDRNLSQFRQYETDAVDHTSDGSLDIEKTCKYLASESLLLYRHLNGNQHRSNKKPTFYDALEINTHVFLRQGTHRFAELGMIGVPQSAQSMRCTAGAGRNSILISLF
jgi:hypothetical protein